MLPQILLGLYVAIILGLMCLYVAKRVKRKHRMLDPIFDYEESVKNNTVANMIFLLLVSNSVSDHNDPENRAQAMMMESELIYRLSQEDTTDDESESIFHYFNNPETILDNVRFDIIKV